MTSLGESGYGAIYLTANALVDFSDGATISWRQDMSRGSTRHWTDLWITPPPGAQHRSRLRQGEELPRQRAAGNLHGGGQQGKGRLHLRAGRRAFRRHSHFRRHSDNRTDINADANPQTDTGAKPYSLTACPPLPHKQEKAG